MVVRLGEVVVVAKGTLIFTCTGDLIYNTASNGGTRVVVGAEVVFTNFEDNWLSNNGFITVESESTLPSVVVCTAISLGKDVSEVTSKLLFAIWRSMVAAEFRVKTASGVFAMVREVTILMDADGVKTWWPDTFHLANNLDSLFIINSINAFHLEINMSVHEGLVGIGHVSTGAFRFLSVIC